MGQRQNFSRVHTREVPHTRSPKRDPQKEGPGQNLEPKRGRFAAPFEFEFWAPKKERRICVETGQDPPEAGPGTRDPQPNDKNRAGALQNRAYHRGRGPLRGRDGKSRTRRGRHLEFGNLPRKVDALAGHIRWGALQKSCGGSPIARPRRQPRVWGCRLDGEDGGEGERCDEDREGVPGRKKEKATERNAKCAMCPSRPHPGGQYQRGQPCVLAQGGA
jgi:hypothetical protein